MILDNESVVTETLVPVNGIELCTETFGEPDDPALLLIAGAARSMDWWEDEFCRRLAAAGRYVIRYDHRDTGRSTSFPPGSPPYAEADLANDALGVLDALSVHRAHLVGMSMGAALARRIAVERPHRVLSLTLLAAGPAEAPDPHRTWSDRRTAVNQLVAAAHDLGGPFTADDAHLRRLAERAYDRTRDMAAAQLNHHRRTGGPAAHDRPGRIVAPTLILHGTLDPLVPAGHARALADEIPGSRLVWLEGVGHEIPPAAVWSQVIDEIREAGRRRQPA